MPPVAVRMCAIGDDELLDAWSCGLTCIQPHAHVIHDSYLSMAVISSGNYST